MELKVKSTDIDFYCTREEKIGLLMEAINMGYEKGMLDAGKRDRNISQREAYKIFTPARVRQWVNNGDISPQTNGKGRNSKRFYDYETLLKLNASDKIVIRKPYIKNKTITNN